jgi:large subunit ribosomal protein L25
VSEVRIAAEPRTEFGKGAARRTRRAGKVPAVLYGHGAEPRHLSLPSRELALALRRDANALLTLEVEGGSELALAKDVQRDPIKQSIEHVDLIAVRRGEKVTVDVPITLVGEAARDTLVDQLLTSLSLEAEATNLPTGVEVDIAGLAVGQQIHASQVPLPAGATLVSDAELLVVNGTAAPTAEQIDAELSEAEAEVGAGQAGQEAAAAEAAADEPAGEGDIVPDTDSAAGGPGGAPSGTSGE